MHVPAADVLLQCSCGQDGLLLAFELVRERPARFAVSDHQWSRRRAELYYGRSGPGQHIAGSLGHVLVDLGDEPMWPARAQRPADTVLGRPGEGGGVVARVQDRRHLRAGWDLLERHHVRVELPQRARDETVSPVPVGVSGTVNVHGDDAESRFPRWRLDLGGPTSAMTRV